jgi:hypothetical protein
MKSGKENEVNDLNNNICLIGKNVEQIKDELGLVQGENKIENLWNIISYEKKDKNDMDSIINKLIDSIKKNIEDSGYSKKIFSYTIIYSLEDYTEEIDCLKKMFTKIVKISPSFFYQPFFIFLAKDENDKNEFSKFINGDDFEKIGIDKRNISCFISPLNHKNDLEMIKRKILKIFAYFYESGDEFQFRNKPYILYNKNNEDLYSFNILTLGKTQVGKSTFINSFLKEKKAKEGGKRAKCNQRAISISFR